jgi:hypothetical protein
MYSIPQFGAIFMVQKTFFVPSFSDAGEGPGFNVFDCDSSVNVNFFDRIERPCRSTNRSADISSHPSLS